MADTNYLQCQMDLSMLQALASCVVTHDGKEYLYCITEQSNDIEQSLKCKGDPEAILKRIIGVDTNGIPYVRILIPE